MTLYVDDVSHRFGRMIMCHMWATTVNELHDHAAFLGLRRVWFQQPPKASWEHYDVSLTVKRRALVERNAALTDKYEPLAHTSRLLIASGDPVKVTRGEKTLARIAQCRTMFKLPVDGILGQGVLL